VTVPKLRLAIIGLLVAITALPPAGNAQSRSLRVAITHDEGTLNPYTYQSGYPGWLLMTLVYDTLFYPDLDNVPRPWIVRDTKVSADGKTWTLTLRPNLRWHNGRALTAEDVKFTYEYVKKFPHPRWTPEVRDIESIETPSPQMVVLRLRAPYVDFLANRSRMFRSCLSKSGNPLRSQPSSPTPWGVAPIEWKRFVRASSTGW
jgi:peptide/nickel transport system substrate-binding protein